MKAPVATAIAIGVGLLVLLGYFLPLPVLQNVRDLLLNWGVTLLGVAALVGIFNLLMTHVRKLFPSHEVKRDVYSLFLLIAFVVTLGLGLWLSPGEEHYQHVVTSIQAPLETSLIAVLSISLLYGGFRLLQHKRDIQTLVFLISAVLFLLLSSGIFSQLGSIPVFSGISNFLQQIPLAGARGILLGVALGSLLTSIRILLGVDRPYSG